VSSLLPLVNAFSKPDDIVMDCFCGSGSIGVAAHECGRRYILIEKDAGFHQVAAQRLTEIRFRNKGQSPDLRP
jgi:adenine-specific DNA-methyltransferase